MNTPSRNFNMIAVTIVVAAIIISATIFASTTFHTTITSTSTATSTIKDSVTDTLVQTSTVAQTVTTTATSTIASVVVSTTTATATSTSTSTLISTITSTSTSTYDPFPSPILQVDLNATMIRQGGAVTAVITIVNVLPENISIAPNYPSNSTIAQWNEKDFVCNNSPIWSLAGYALLQGHYSSENISSAGAPLELAPPVALPCAFPFNPALFVLLPDGSNAVGYYATPGANSIQVNLEANARTESCTSTPQTSECPVGDSLFGYWNTTGVGALPLENATTSSQYFHHFPSGQYTLVTEDIWGQTDYSYFQVLSP
jgi:hypothetical protein